MSLNERMHERNPFKHNPPDFVRLSRLYPDFAPHCIKDSNTNKLRIDFKNADSLRSLCCTLLKDLFDYDLEIPNDHLIPRIPQRLNYVLWIEDLLERPLVAKGIDIGCGSSCIFALLCCGLNKEFQMLATDISDENLKYAQKNVNINKLDSRIRLLKIENESSIIENIFKTNDDQYDFLMCNPPFFSSESELEGVSRKPEKRPLPKSINTGKLHESVYLDGGEVGFVKKMIDESIKIGSKIRIYTTMLGRKKSLDLLKKYLAEKEIKNLSETEFCQGHTMRWGLCWSLSQKLEAKQSKPSTKPIRFEITLKKEQTLSYLYEFIKKLFQNELKLDVLNENNLDELSFTAYENTWSKQRQKRRAEQRKRARLSPSKNSLVDNNNECLSVNETKTTNREKILIEFKLKLHALSLVKLNLELEGLTNANTSALVEEKELLNQIQQYLRNKLSI